MFRENKLAKYLIVSGLLHLLIAVAMAKIYAEQPQRHKPLMIKKAVRIQYEEPEPPPKPKVVIPPQPKKVTPKKVEPKPKEEPKVVPQKVEPPKSTRRRRRMSAAASSLGNDTSSQKRVSAPGVAAMKGARGSMDEGPTAASASGISDPNIVTKTGGIGLSPGRTHGSMAMPEGTGHLPGAGGKEVAGFRIGNSGTGTGVGEIDVSGSGGRGGKSDEGPGTGRSSFASKVNVGGGQGTTGLGAGKSDGMDQVDSAPAGNKPGGGSGDGPGTGGYDAGGSRSAPSLTGGSGSKSGNIKELPSTKNIPEDKRDGALGKKEFKADAKTDMTAAKQAIEKPEERGFTDAFQSEINKNLHDLRKIHENWQNSKLSNIPRVLQITIELKLEKGKPKLQKLELHKSDLSSRIKDPYQDYKDMEI